MPHPVPIIIGTTLAVIGSGYAFKKFVYDPHLAPLIDAWVGQHRTRGYQPIPVPVESPSAGRSTAHNGAPSPSGKGIDSTGARRRHPAEVFELDEARMLPDERGADVVPPYLPPYAPRTPRSRTPRSPHSPNSPTTPVAHTRSHTPGAHSKGGAEDEKTPVASQAFVKPQPVPPQTQVRAQAPPIVHAPVAQPSPPMVQVDHTLISLERAARSPTLGGSPGSALSATVSASASPGSQFSMVDVTSPSSSDSPPARAIGTDPLLSLSRASSRSTVLIDRSALTSPMPTSYASSPMPASLVSGMSSPSLLAVSDDEADAVSVAGTSNSYVDAEAYTPSLVRSPLSAAGAASPGTPLSRARSPMPNVNVLLPNPTMFASEATLTPSIDVLAATNALNLSGTNVPSESASDEHISLAPPSVSSWTDDEQWRSDSEWDVISDAGAPA